MFKISLVLLSMFLLSSCAGIKTRSTIYGKKQQFGSSDEVKPSGSEDSAEAIEPEVKKQKTIGLILGGGGFKTLAHAGVLQAFEQEKIPIEHIVGLGFSSVIAGAFSTTNSVSNVQWKMKKWKASDFPSVGFMSKRFESVNIGDWLQDVFDKKELQKKTNNFSCPSRSYLTGKIMWKRDDRLASMLETCAAVPPIFNSKTTWVGAPGTIKDSMLYLRRKGVEKIIFVNVMPKNGIMFVRKEIKNNQGDALYWQSVREEYNNIEEVTNRYSDVYVLNVNTGSQPLLTFRNFNILNIEGLRLAKSFIKDL